MIFLKLCTFSRSSCNIPVKMKTSIALFAFCAVLGLAYGATTFTTKYDNVDLDEILRSDRLLNNYFGCLMDKKKCTPDGTELKKAIPLALKEDCAGCSEKQRVGAEKVIKYISKNKPTEWKDLEAKYDPTGVWRKKHAGLASEKGVTV